MLSTLYTGQGKPEDLRVRGPLNDILQIAWLLHEATPYVALLVHERDQIGILVTRVDRRYQHVVRKLRLSYPEVSTNYLPLVEILRYPLLQPFTFHRIGIQPYSGPVQLPRRWEPVTTPGTRFYHIVDTPNAELAQGLASYFPTYVYQAQNGYVTYIQADPVTLINRLRSVTMDLNFIPCRGLPYESTCPISPIQKHVEIPVYP